MTFICKRCDTEFAVKAYLKTHLLRVRPCECTNLNIERNILIDELYQRKLNYKTFDCDYCGAKFNHSSGKSQHKKICKSKPLDKINLLEHTIENLVSKIDKLEAQPQSIDKIKLDLQYYKNRKNENFYQLLIENFLGGSHKTLSCGITDVTTDSCHAEIKEWPSWKEAIGQLTCYNIADPKEKLEMYMFGKYKQSCKDEAVKIAVSCKINIYEFIDTDNEISIISLENNEIVYIYKPE